MNKGGMEAFDIFVSFMMTFLVLPLCSVHHYPVNLLRFVHSTMILMFTIGLPISAIVGIFYSGGHSILK